MIEEYDFSKGVRGSVRTTRPNTTQISFRVDDDILDWFREKVAGGGNYQTMMNDVLRNFMGDKKGPPKDLNRVV